MRKEKQLFVLNLLRLGYYKTEGNKVFRCWKKTWQMTGGTLPSGYKQHMLSDRKGCKSIIYEHIIIYLDNYGAYPEGYVIDHIDNDNTNNNPKNLRAVTQRDNTLTSDKSPKFDKQSIKYTKIRSNEIQSIKLLMSKGCSQSYIAKLLGANRSSVRYIIKQIESGVSLKFE